MQTSKTIIVIAIVLLSTIKASTQTNELIYFKSESGQSAERFASMYNSQGKEGEGSWRIAQTTEAIFNGSKTGYDYWAWLIVPIRVPNGATSMVLSLPKIGITTNTRLGNASSYFMYMITNTTYSDIDDLLAGRSSALYAKRFATGDKHGGNLKAIPRIAPTVDVSAVAGGTIYLIYVVSDSWSDRADELKVSSPTVTFN